MAIQTKTAKPTTKPVAQPKPAPAKNGNGNGYPIVTVLGRLGADPEAKTVGAEGKLVCEFSLAEDIFTGAKDENGKAVKEARWYRVSTWENLAINAGYLAKGQEVVVRGKLKVTQGEKREFRDITAYTVRVAGPIPEPELTDEGDA